VLAASCWQLGSTTRRRAGWLTLVTVAIAMGTPLVRASAWLDPLPDALEAYLRPGRGLTTFALFPWAAFVTAGAACGLAIRAAGTSGGARVAAGCAVAGLVLVAGGYGLSFRPSIYAHSSFWTSSPTFLCVRVGLLTLAVGAAWLWGRWRMPRRGWSPLEVLGASSLFVYWVHLEMVYGVVATPLRRALTVPQAILAFALFSGFMLLLTIVKGRVVARFGARSPLHTASPGGVLS
jgi:uncharacterized membrane protein